MDVAAENYDLVELVVRKLGRRYRLDEFHDDLVSAGNEAIVEASRDPGLEDVANVRQWLAGTIHFACIDWLRATYGRDPASARRQGTRDALSLNESVQNRPGMEATERGDLVPSRVDVVDESLARVQLAELLAACPTDRHRQVVVLAAAGEYLSEIGTRLGVTESRASQMLSLVRRRAGGWQPPARRTRHPLARRSFRAMVEKLSPRELEVVVLAAGGLSAAQTGRRLFLSEETIKAHRKHVLAKLQARNMTHAVAIVCLEKPDAVRPSV